MGFFNTYLQNLSKPDGLLGQLVVAGMNVGHIPVSWFGLSHLKFGKKQDILDIGCGGGANIRRMLALSPRGTNVDGVDYSEASVSHSIRKNRCNVDRGRSIITVGDVSALDKPDNQYDLVTAFETVYFWPDLNKAFSEVYRVLKPGGMFMISNEYDGTREQHEKYAEMIDAMTNHTPDELKAYLEAAGFKDIVVDVNKLHMVVIMGYKR